MSSYVGARYNWVVSPFSRERFTMETKIEPDRRLLLPCFPLQTEMQLLLAIGALVHEFSLQFHLTVNKQNFFNSLTLLALEQLHVIPICFPEIVTSEAKHHTPVVLASESLIARTVACPHA